MDEKYFWDKKIKILDEQIMFQINKNINQKSALKNHRNILDILQQIARDAAKEQRDKCMTYCEYKTKLGCVNCPEEITEFPDV
jgi:hypothetical protein